MPSLADLIRMGNQYVSDALPGGSLNPEVTQNSLRNAAELASMMPNPVGDIASGGLALSDLIRGNYQDAALNGVGLLPFVPAMGGVIKNIPAPRWLAGKTTIPVGVNPTREEMAQLFKHEKANTGYFDVRVLKPEDAAQPLYVWPASSALHQDVGSHFSLDPKAYRHQQWSAD